MDWSLLISFAAMAAVIVVSPGPNFLLVTRSVPAFGISGALANCTGFSCSYMLHGTLAIFGVSAILAAEPLLLTLIQLAGAGYLLKLGVKSFKLSARKLVSPAVSAIAHPIDILLTPATNAVVCSGNVVSMKNRMSLAFSGNRQGSNTGIDTILEDDCEIAPDMGLFNCFRDGMLISAFNPKISLFYMAAFPQFILGSTDTVTSSYSLVLVHIAISVLWGLVVAVVLNYALKKAGSYCLADKLDRFSGFALIGLSMAFFTSAAQAF